MPFATRVPLFAAALALILGLALFAGMGAGPDWRVNLLAVLAHVIIAGAPAGAYVLGGIGLGRIFSRLTRGTKDPVLLNSALGVGAMLWLSHALGSLGLLAGNSGRVLAYFPVVGGLVLMAVSLRRAGLVRLSPIAAVSALAIALLLVAASNPPGWLWESEFRGYDALSYHLPLAQEWLLNGRITGLEHNVYSFLPSAVESAFVHLGVLTFAPADPTSTLPGGLLAGDGWRLISCQMLHAFLAVFAAWCAARSAASLIPTGADGRSCAGPVAFTLTIGTPWMIVTGSLAYNEAPLVAFTIVALAASTHDAPGPVRRGVIVGLLVGIACIVKPTALLFAAAPCAMLLSLRVAPRQWAHVAIAGTFAGLIVLGPWIGRGLTSGGNPFFPHLTKVFGTGHWTGEQVSRYVARHAFDGSLLDRVGLLFLPDLADPAGPRHRGLFHPQWGLFFVIAAAGIASLICRTVTRRLGLLLLGAMVVQIALWMTFTHVQSRFLLPALGIGAAGAGLAVAHIRNTRMAWGLGALLALVQVSLAAWGFSRQNNASPNALLVPGPALRTGGLLRAAIRERPDAATMDAILHAASPEAFSNTVPRRGGRLCLIGASTPLYFWPVPIYNTTYDRWPLGDAIRENPDDPHAWSVHLRSLGMAEAMVDFGEVERLFRWGAGDPDVTPDRVRRWLATTRLVRAWDGAGIHFVQLPRTNLGPGGQSP